MLGNSSFPNRPVWLALAAVAAGAAVPGSASAAGLFGPSSNLSADQRGVFVPAAADVDGDGDLDLVDPSVGTVSYFPNNGTGGFGALVDSGVSTGSTFESGGETIPGYSNAVAAGDLTGDGKVDLVYGSEAGVFLLVNEGAGAFAPAEQLGTDAGTTGNSTRRPLLEIRDVTGDGKLDVIFETAAKVVVLEGDGTGELTAAGELPLTGQARLGDVNGDGKLDVVGYDAASGFTVLGDVGGTSHPVLWSAPAPGAGRTPIYDFAVGDVTGDGKSDLLAVSDGARQFCDSEPEFCPPVDPDTTKAPSDFVFAGKGDGTFALVSQRPHGTPGQAAAIGDFDGDGKGDLAVAFGEAYNDSVDDLVETFAGERARNATLFGNYVLIQGLLAADLNGDGRDDLVGTSGYGGYSVALATAPAGTTKALQALSGVGNTSTVAFPALTAGAKYTVTVGGTYSPYADALYTSKYHFACGTTDLIRHRTSDAEGDFGWFSRTPCGVAPSRTNHRFMISVGAGFYDPAPTTTSGSTYTYTVTGKGLPFTARLKDSSGRDNSGALLVSVTPVATS